MAFDKLHIIGIKNSLQPYLKLVSSNHMDIILSSFIKNREALFLLTYIDDVVIVGNDMSKIQSNKNLSGKND